MNGWTGDTFLHSPVPFFLSPAIKTKKTSTDVWEADFNRNRSNINVFFMACPRLVLSQDKFC